MLKNLKHPNLVNLIEVFRNYFLKIILYIISDFFCNFTFTFKESFINFRYLVQRRILWPGWTYSLVSQFVLPQLVKEKSIPPLDKFHIRGLLYKIVYVYTAYCCKRKIYHSFQPFIVQQTIWKLCCVQTKAETPPCFWVLWVDRSEPAGEVSEGSSHAAHQNYRLANTSGTENIMTQFIFT